MYVCSLRGMLVSSYQEARQRRFITAPDHPSASKHCYRGNNEPSLMLGYPYAGITSPPINGHQTFPSHARR